MSDVTIPHQTLTPHCSGAVVFHQWQLLSEVLTRYGNYRTIMFYAANFKVSSQRSSTQTSG